MSDNDMEMGTMDRPANRFQVNPVKRVSVDKYNTEHYKKLNYEKDGPPEGIDDDYLEELNEINYRRKSRPLSMKSSFRDKDKVKSSQSARFDVNAGNDSDSNDEENLLDNDNDTRYGKSFRHFTREALPRLDNYRNILSIQAVYRPTLDELHNATLSNKNTHSHGHSGSEAPQEGTVKFGWITGVLIRCILNIWGVMLFLRLSWVVGQAGVGEAILLILTTTVVTMITALSMSAISTNGVIKGGGTYYMISRSLGPEFGGSIGLIFSLANAVACAMYVVGFCESMNSLLKSFGVSIIDNSVNDVRIIGCITIVILTIIVVVGMEWEAKAQLGLLVILVVAIIDFFVGIFMGPKSELERAQGFIGLNSTLLKENLQPDYRLAEGVQHNFFSVFAIFFPAATGILAGANISGDLKDPQKAIPQGTLLAIVITTLTYVVMAIAAGASVLRDATGNITHAVNGSSEFMNCVPGECAFGLHNSFQVIELTSAFGPIIYAGCFAATISSALASLVSAPKVFQALCKDELYPKIVWFAKGFGKNNEPVRGYVLTFILAVAFILIGELNLIAPLISNFFLAAYMLINFSTFHASLAKPIGWRPTFKYYNMWLSLVGAILCVAVMFLISWSTALLTFGVVIALYLIVSHQKPDVNWGSTTQAQTYKNALISVQQLNNVEEHVKNYRPQILVLTGQPNSRPILVDFAYLLTKNLSLLVCGHALKGQTNQRQRNFLQHKASEWFMKHKIKGFYSLVDGKDFESSARALMQASGVGKLKPNIVLMGFKLDWNKCNRDDLVQYFNTIHNALDMHLAVVVLRLEKGLDYSQVLGDDFNKMNLEIPKPLQPTDSTPDFQTNYNEKIHGSIDSLSRNVSQVFAHANGKESEQGPKPDTKNKSSSTSDLSLGTGPNASGAEAQEETPDVKLLSNFRSNPKNRREDPSHLYKAPGGGELPKQVLQELTQFTKKRSNAVIDVWWLYDDGGLTLLLPYIISTRRTWNMCKLRVFALANKKDELEFEQRSMASLLAKFRIDYSDLQLLPDVISKKPQDSTTNFFNELVKEFTVPENTENGENVEITESDLLAVKDKTNRYLRLRELLLENSMKSDLVVMTLPMPRKNIVSAPLYMAWLEVLSRDMPPFLFVRGNQSSVLTFYS